MGYKTTIIIFLNNNPFKPTIIFYDNKKEEIH
jgi:hypothetical protein